MSKLTVESIIRIYGSKVKEVKVFNEKKRAQAENFLQIEPVAFALADEPDVLRIYVDKESAEASLDGTLQDSEQGTEEAQEVKKEEAEDGRKKAIKRTQKLVYYFADFMLQEEEAGHREKAEIEKMMKEPEDSNKVVCAVSCKKEGVSMNNTTVERPVTEKNQDFAALMAEVATLEPQQQEKLTFFVQGYVAAAAGMNERNKAAI